MVIGIVYLVAVVLGWARIDHDLRVRRITSATSQVDRLSVRELASIERWADGRLADAGYWASDPVVVDATRRLAMVDPDDLLADPAQAALRDRLAGFIELNGLAGFFVVTPEGLSLASSRDSNVATPNLVAVDNPQAFDDILAGEARITPPQRSDVVLNDDGLLPETMFVGAPVVVDGLTVAAFMLRIVPSEDLMTIPGDRNLVEGFDQIVFSDSGVAVTAPLGGSPLDPVTTGDAPAAQAFGGRARGTNVAPDTSTAPSVVEAWATSPDLGLGVVTRYDGDVAFATLRAERRSYAAMAAFAAILGLALIALTYRIAARARERELEAAHLRFRSLVDPSPDPVLRVGLDGTVLAANQALHRMLDAHAGPTTAEAPRSGRRKDADIPMTIDELGRRNAVLYDVAARWPIVSHTVGPTQIERINVVDADLNDRYFRVRFVPVIVDQQDSEVLVVLTDQSADVERELRLEEIARIDSLTGLANRAAITDRLHRALEGLQGPNPATGVAVMVVDLDHFKSVNDAFGHAAGDRVLEVLSQRLAGSLRENESVGRVGGDEFIVVSEGVGDLATAEQAAARLVEHLDGVQVDIDGSLVAVTSSVGVAWTAEPAEPAAMIADADRAMLHAKHRRGGRGFAVSRPGGTSTAEPSGELARDLFGALERDEFEMYYQAIVDADGLTHAVEALLRWNHPRFGLLTPTRFLSTLAQSGFIGPVGRWGVAEAIAQAGRWSDAGTPIKLHVNVSPIEMAGGVVDALDEAIRRAQIEARWICVEVTEHAFDGNVMTSGSMARLADLGVEIALDDFGTGASTLSHLRQQPLHAIKLDQNFVRSLDADEPESMLDEPIVQAIIGLAHSLDLVTIAEGVENTRQLAWLHSRGCRYFQGWAFAQPQPAAAIDPNARLTAHDWTGPHIAGHDTQ